MQCLKSGKLFPPLQSAVPFNQSVISQITSTILAPAQTALVHEAGQNLCDLKWSCPPAPAVYVSAIPIGILALTAPQALQVTSNMCHLQNMCPFTLSWCFPSLPTIKVLSFWQETFWTGGGPASQGQGATRCMQQFNPQSKVQLPHCSSSIARGLNFLTAGSLIKSSFAVACFDFQKPNGLVGCSHCCLLQDKSRRNECPAQNNSQTTAKHPNAFLT